MEKEGRLPIVKIVVEGKGEEEDMILNEAILQSSR